MGYLCTERDFWGVYRGILGDSRTQKPRAAVAVWTDADDAMEEDNETSDESDNDVDDDDDDDEDEDDDETSDVEMF